MPFPIGELEPSLYL